MPIQRVVVYTIVESILGNRPLFGPQIYLTIYRTLLFSAIVILGIRPIICKHLDGCMPIGFFVVSVIIGSILESGPI